MEGEVPAGDEAKAEPGEARPAQPARHRETWNESMKKRLISKELILLFTCLATTAHAQEYGPYKATVEKVIDGDTFTASVKIWPGIEAKTRIRIRGINAPEIHTSRKCEKQAGENARKRLENLIQNKTVELTRIKNGKYAGRVLAEVTWQGQNIAEILLKEGLARPYSGGKRQHWCEDEPTKP